MGRFYGKVGFAVQQETVPGIWEEVIEERTYSGEIMSNRWRTAPASDVNRDITLSSDFSILCDPYIKQNYMFIAYVEYMGAKWAVNSAEVNYPRVVLTVGGLWNDSGGDTDASGGDSGVD